MQSSQSEAGACPPHHWWIEDDRSSADSRRFWRCLRCNEQREEPLSRVTVPNRKYRSVSSWSHEEFILADLSLDS